MAGQRHLAKKFGWLFLLFTAGTLLAEEGRSRKWPMDKVILKDGEILQGLIRSEDDTKVHLLWCRVRPGKPLSFIGRKISQDEIDHLQRLTEAQRKELQQRIDDYINRAKQEEIDKDEVELTRGNLYGPNTLSYDGNSFTLYTTASAETARLAALRLEKRFAAFREVLPPRLEPKRELRIILWGSKEEFQAYKARSGIEIQNRAYFDAEHNRVVAYTQADTLLAKHQATLRDLEAQSRELAEKYKAVRAELIREAKILKQIGAKDAQKANSTSKLAFFRQQRESIERDIEKARRHNDQVVNDFLEQNLRTLYHEAFHAYLENFVYDHEHYRVPRWFNEGLAQVYENHLEHLGGKLRAEDSPQQARRLLEDLKGPQPLTLEQILTAPDATFLGVHGTPAKQSERYYLYSWGLAELVRAEILSRESPYQALDAFVDNQSDANSVARLEHLFGKPLPQIEADWKQLLQKLAAPAKSNR